MGNEGIENRGMEEWGMKEWRMEEGRIMTEAKIQAVERIEEATSLVSGLLRF